MEELYQKVKYILEPGGFEIYPFQIGWYNEKVQEPFRLPYPDATLAFCVISTPCMFEKSFLPFVERLREKSTIENRDPVDSCMMELLTRVQQALLPECESDLIQDFEVDPRTRRPRLLVQTVGHVSGAAYYYKREDVEKPPWPEKKKIYGVSLHPKFGGWFAFRGAIILKNVTSPDLQPSLAQKPLTKDEDIIDLLERFNLSWKDGTYRDVIDVKERYSEEQIRYWDTPPAKRFALLGQEDKLETNSVVDELRGSHF